MKEIILKKDEILEINKEMFIGEGSLKLYINYIQRDLYGYSVYTEKGSLYVHEGREYCKSRINVNHIYSNIIIQGLNRWIDYKDCLIDVEFLFKIPTCSRDKYQNYLVNNGMRAKRAMLETYYPIERPVDFKKVKELKEYIINTFYYWSNLIYLDTREDI